MRLKSFFAGVGGGVLGAALLVLALLLTSSLGDTQQIAVRLSPTDEATPVATSGKGFTPQQIYRSLSPGVVMVQADFGDAGVNLFGELESGRSMGTGFVVDAKGHILTNAHVVEKDRQRAVSLTIVFNKSRGRTQRVEGSLVGVDSGSDVAVIKVKPSDVDLKPLPLGDSDDVVVGEPVVAIGNPLGYDFSITSGIVSAVGRSLQAPNGMTISNGIQTDAAINPGNSGGPLIDSNGKVIGVNEQIASESGGNQGLGFAVPINAAVRSLEQLKDDGTVEYAWLGVAGQTLTQDVAKLFNMTSQGGALVEQVSEGSPAAKAGIRGGSRTVGVQGQSFVIGGDVVVRADGKTISGFEGLIAYLSTKKPGDEITLTVERDGKMRDVKVTLAERPSDL